MSAYNLNSCSPEQIQNSQCLLDQSAGEIALRTNGGPGIGNILSQYKRIHIFDKQQQKKMAGKDTNLHAKQSSTASQMLRKQFQETSPHKEVRALTNIKKSPFQKTIRYMSQPSDKKMKRKGAGSSSNIKNLENLHKLIKQLHEMKNASSINEYSRKLNLTLPQQMDHLKSIEQQISTLKKSLADGDNLPPGYSGYNNDVSCNSAYFQNEQSLGLQGPSDFIIYNKSPPNQLNLDSSAEITSLPGQMTQGLSEEITNSKGGGSNYFTNSQENMPRQSLDNEPSGECSTSKRNRRVEENIIQYDQDYLDMADNRLVAVNPQGTVQPNITNVQILRQTASQEQQQHQRMDYNFDEQLYLFASKMTSPTPHVDSSIEQPLAMSAATQSSYMMRVGGPPGDRLSPAAERDREKFLMESQQKKEEHEKKKKRMANIYMTKVKFFHNASNDKSSAKKIQDSKGFSIKDGKGLQASQENLTAQGLSEVTSFGALLGQQAASFDTRNPPHKMSEIVNIGSVEQKDPGDSLNHLPSPYMLPKNQHDEEDLKSESRQPILHGKKMSVQGENSAHLPLALPGVVSQMGGNPANAQSAYQFHSKPKSHLQAYNASRERARGVFSQRTPLDSDKQTGDYTFNQDLKKELNDNDPSTFGGLQESGSIFREKIGSSRFLPQYLKKQNMKSLTYRKPESQIQWMEPVQKKTPSRSKLPNPMNSNTLYQSIPKKRPIAKALISRKKTSPFRAKPLMATAGTDQPLNLTPSQTISHPKASGIKDHLSGSASPSSAQFAAIIAPNRNQIKSQEGRQFALQTSGLQEHFPPAATAPGTQRMPPVLNTSRIQQQQMQPAQKLNFFSHRKITPAEPALPTFIVPSLPDTTKAPPTNPSQKMSERQTAFSQGKSRRAAAGLSSSNHDAYLKVANIIHPPYLKTARHASNTRPFHQRKKDSAGSFLMKTAYPAGTATALPEGQNRSLAEGALLTSANPKFIVGAPPKFPPTLTVNTVKSGQSEVENLSLLDNPTSVSKEQVQPYRQTFEATASPSSNKQLTISSVPPRMGYRSKSPASRKKLLLSTTESMQKLGAREKKAAVIASFKKTKKRGGESSQSYIENSYQQFMKVFINKGMRDLQVNKMGTTISMSSSKQIVQKCQVEAYFPKTRSRRGFKTQRFDPKIDKQISSGGVIDTEIRSDQGEKKKGVQFLEEENDENPLEN